jgi:CheY-like chemotaxis protein
MKRNGDIIIIEDDADDREILTEAFEQVLAENNYSNRIVMLEDSATVIDYLKESGTEPFLMMSDINMPKVDGFTLRNRIFSDPDLKDRCIPYIFLTTSGSNENYIQQAYQLSVQGYFSKPVKFEDYKTLIAGIINYWKVSKTPS